MENVRVTAPDLQRRAALDKMRSRLLLSAAGFMLLFGAVVAKLSSATILFPMIPKLPAEVARVPDPAALALADGDGTAPAPAPGTIPASTARAPRSSTATARSWRSRCRCRACTPTRRR